MKYSLSILLFLLITAARSNARTISVGNGYPVKTIQAAIQQAQHGDTILVYPGHYKEKNLVIAKSIYLIGKGRPIIDGEYKYENISIKAPSVLVEGFRIIRCGVSSIEDFAGIKIYDQSYVVIRDNILEETFFGIYTQYAKHCLIQNNVLRAYNKQEQQSGNGIHCWKSDSLQIIGNKTYGHRDGIYFEFVTHSIIWRNLAYNNLRYGLHFMFSNDNAYISNLFKNNGAGVAVMFTKKVVMINNSFEDNLGDAAYGLLFKEISDCYLSGNKFIRNTTGIFFDGSNRIIIERNIFKENGWGMRLQANCMDNVIQHNNFLGNTFDMATNGSLTLNMFSENYWDKYQGYDLNRDKIGDVPYHPLSLYAVIVEQNPPAMLLYRSFMVNLLDQSEKLSPSLTPENFVDNKPSMAPHNL